MNCQVIMDSLEIQDKLNNRFGEILIDYSPDWDYIEEQLVKEVAILFQTTKDPVNLSIQLQDLVTVCSEIRNGHYHLADSDAKYYPPLFKGVNTPLNVLLRELSYQERKVDEIKSCLLKNTEITLHNSLDQCTEVIDQIEDDLKKLGYEEIDPDLITRAWNLHNKLQQLTSC